MPKMKQLGYSIYELSKMQNSWTVRELKFFLSKLRPIFELSPSEMIVAGLGKLSSTSSLLIRLGPWLMSSSATLHHFA